MPTKVVAAADLHIHRWREFARADEDGRNNRMMDCVSVIGDAVRLARKENADAIVVSGDLFHRRGFLATEEFNLTSHAIASAAEEFRVLLTPGNHDQADLAGKVHSLAPFAYIPGVTVCEEPEVITLGKHMVLMVPYVEDPVRLRKIVGSYTSDYVFAHCGVDGAKVGSFESKPKEEFKVEDFGKLPKGKTTIFLGHYHKHQVLGGGKVAYIGAPLQHTRTDAGEARGLMTVDLDAGTFKRSLLSRPRFVVLTDDDIANKDPDDWDVEGNFVDIVLTEEPSGGIERFRKMADGLPVRGINIVFAPKAVQTKTRIKVDPGMDLGKMIERYIEKVAPPTLDSRRLEKLAKEFLTP